MRKGSASHGRTGPLLLQSMFLHSSQVLAGRDLQLRYSADAVLPDHLIGTPWQVLMNSNGKRVT